MPDFSFFVQKNILINDVVFIIKVNMVNLKEMSQMYHLVKIHYSKKRLDPFGE